MRVLLHGRLLLATGVLAMFAACATTRTTVAPLDLAQQQAALRALPSYTLEGRVAVRAGEEGWQASVRWRQRGDISEVRLAGPFGAGALQLRFDGEELRLTGSRGETLRGDEATAALRKHLGFDPPLAALRYWLLAQPAPAEPTATLQPGAGGAPASLAQHDWQLSYEDYRAESLQQGKAQLPRRITATRDAVRLRLVVDRWRLGARH